MTGHSVQWEKKGLVFSPPKDGGWMKSHAQVPTPLACDDRIRVYFSSRPEPTVSLTTFVDLDKSDPTRILRIHEEPILPLGKPGTFDEHGIMPSCAVRNGDAVFLYYSGWSRGTSVPYTNSTGLAVSDDGGETFSKISEGPIVAKNAADPYSATSPCVLKEGSVWHMWYCSGTGWVKINEKYEHTYDIKYARSDDGIAWDCKGHVSVAQRNDYEALTRPFVDREGGEYRMWFCYRGSHDFRKGDQAYRIGYAHSEDALHWEREDEASGLPPSESGWDSKMIAYPAIVRSNGQTWMFYNGNDFGAEGFGLAASGTG